MNIECVTHREGGSRVDIDGIEYHFEPLSDGCHVADVEEPKHQDRFLGLSEGYKLYRGELSPVGKPTKIGLPVVNDKADLRRQDSVVARTLHGSFAHESSYEIGGKTYQLGDVVSRAFYSSKLTAEEWNGLEEEDRNAKIDIALDELAEEEDAGTESKTDDKEALSVEYKAKFGKAPHYRMTAETIKAALAE
jgi:hypothetical protein